MTRILSSIFYISSMRKTSEELNSDIMIENIWSVCKEKPTVDELPYWETINRYLAKLNPDDLQKVVMRLCYRLLRSRAFEDMRIRGKYWQIIIDGTQLYSTSKELDGKSLYRIHGKGTAEERRENYYYVLEAKLLLRPNIIVSICTEFVENTGEDESEKQDCERKACWRLMKKLKKAFPILNICLCADSLYACERFFQECAERKWHYILRFKEGSIPTIAREYEALKKIQRNYQERKLKDGIEWYDYVTEINYNEHLVNLVEYKQERTRELKKGTRKGIEEPMRKQFCFITDLTVNRKNVASVVEQGRMRWKIENEGFNTQKRKGYNLEHLFSKKYTAIKNHYYLIQIGHMISQIMEAWESLWRHTNQSLEQKHRQILESFKEIRLTQFSLEERFQIRFI